MADITAIFVTYNSAQVISHALVSLAHDPHIARIIVVDNASSDDTVTIIARDFPAVEIIRNKENLGFGSANNIALEKVTTPYALLINPDAFLQPGASTALLETATRNPEAALIASILHDDKGYPLASFNRDLFTRKRRAPFILPEGDCCADFLSGALWLARMSALRQVGFYDPNIFFYCEDDDLCLRLRRAGYSLIIAANARGTHGMGKSSAPSKSGKSFRLYHFTWSRLYMEYKWHGQRHAKLITVLWLIKFTLNLLFAYISFIPALRIRYQARLKATLDFALFLFQNK